MTLLEADAAFVDERLRWAAGTEQLHCTVDELVDSFAWLTAELQALLAASPAAGSVRRPVSMRACLWVLALAPGPPWPSLAAC